MAHPHDLNCRWCGAPLGGWRDTSCGKMFVPMHVVCASKPPLTPDEGAAAAFGLMGMAEAIRQRPLCPHGTLLKYGGDCLDCWEDPHESEPKCANCRCGLHYHGPDGCSNGAHGWECGCLGFEIRPTSDDRSAGEETKR